MVDPVAWRVTISIVAAEPSLIEPMEESVMSSSLQQITIQTFSERLLRVMKPDVGFGSACHLLSCWSLVWLIF
jgi:hypothetical protein